MDLRKLRDCRRKTPLLQRNGGEQNPNSDGDKGTATEETAPEQDGEKEEVRDVRGGDRQNRCKTCDCGRRRIDTRRNNRCSFGSAIRK